jgi:hypothetical protein
MANLSDFEGQGGSDNEVAPSVAPRNQRLIASVVNPTIGRPESLSRCLTSVLHQTFLRPAGALLASSAPARLEFSGLAATGCFGPRTVSRADRSAAWGTSNLAQRRDAFLALGGFRERVSAGEDRDLAVRAGAAGHQAAFIDGPATYWRSFTRRDLWSQQVERASRLPVGLVFGRRSSRWPTR